jgi:hypothetical protein
LLTVSQNSKTVYVGAYERYVAVPINVDTIWYPNLARGFVGIDAFERSNVGQGSRYISPGLGVFLAVDKNGRHSPARPVGGLTVSYQNQKAQIAVITGWTF